MTGDLPDKRMASISTRATTANSTTTREGPPSPPALMHLYPASEASGAFANALLLSVSCLRGRVLALIAGCRGPLPMRLHGTRAIHSPTPNPPRHPWGGQQGSMGTFMASIWGPTHYLSALPQRNRQAGLQVWDRRRHLPRSQVTMVPRALHAGFQGRRRPSKHRTGLSGPWTGVALPHPFRLSGSSPRSCRRHSIS